VVGFVIVWYFAFLGLYAAVTAQSHPRPVVISRVMGAVVTLAALLVGFALATVIIYTIAKGIPALRHWNFLTQTGKAVGPITPLSKGGIWHVIVGSAIQLGIAVAISLPLGLGTAIFMTEVGGWFSRVVRTVVEAMTALPDLLAGLFVYVTLIVGFHMQRNGLAVGIALSVTMTPIVARSSEVALRVVPGGLREAGLALGASQWSTVRRIVLPTARPGLATALVLAMARGVGESAPLLIVSGASNFLNKDPLNHAMNSLPLYIYQGVRSGEPLSIQRAFGAATVLLFIVFVLFAVMRILARQRVGRR
jgi:phosphate transport system permease protein